MYGMLICDMYARKDDKEVLFTCIYIQLNIQVICINEQVHRNRDGGITLKLADFGLAMEVKDVIYTVCGTPTYVAPEILTESGE